MLFFFFRKADFIPGGDFSDSEIGDENEEWTEFRRIGAAEFGSTWPGWKCSAASIFYGLCSLSRDIWGQGIWATG